MTKDGSQHWPEWPGLNRQGLAAAGAGIAQRIVAQPVDPLQGDVVGGEPVAVVLPAV